MYTTRLLVQPTSTARHSPHLQPAAMTYTTGNNRHSSSSPLKLRTSVSREELKELKKQERQADRQHLPLNQHQWYTPYLQHVAIVYQWAHYVHGLLAMLFGFLLLLSSVGIAAIVGSSHWFTNRPNVPLYVYLSLAVVYLGCEMIYILHATLYRNLIPNRRHRRTLLHHTICMTALITSLIYCKDTWLILIGLLLGELPQPFAALSELKDGMRRGKILSPTSATTSNGSSNSKDSSRKPRTFSFGDNSTSQRNAAPSNNGNALTLPTQVCDWLTELTQLPARELQLCTLVFTRFCMLQYCTHVIIPYAQLATTRYCSLSLMLLSFWSILDLALHISERGRLLFINWPF